MCSSDRRVVKERAEQFKKLKAKRKVERAAIRGNICKLFKVKEFGPPSDGQQRAKRKAMSIDRWWNSITGDPEFILENKPAPARLFTDQWNGRFRLSYPGEKPRSVSWTVKGQRAASLEALRVMRAWHTASTGQQPPIPLDVEVCDAIVQGSWVYRARLGRRARWRHSPHGKHAECMRSGSARACGLCANLRIIYRRNLGRRSGDSSAEGAALIATDARCQESRCLRCRVGSPTLAFLQVVFRLAWGGVWQWFPPCELDMRSAYGRMYAALRCSSIARFLGPSLAGLRIAQHVCVCVFVMHVQFGSTSLPGSSGGPGMLHA